jgi:hypothetical protein
LGPEAQRILAPFLDRAPDSCLFSPAESEQWRLENRPPYHGRERKTPVYASRSGTTNSAHTHGSAAKRPTRSTLPSPRPIVDHVSSRGHGGHVARRVPSLGHWFAATPARS